MSYRQHRATRAEGEADEVVNTAEAVEMDRVVRLLKMANSCQPMKILCPIRCPDLPHPFPNPPVFVYKTIKRFLVDLIRLK